MVLPRATRTAPVSVATSTITSGLSCVDGVRQRVGQHEPALGVGVVDLAGATAVVVDDVARPHGVGADGVLRGGDQTGHPHRTADGGQRAEDGDDDAATGHVALHRRHALGRS